MLEGNYAQIMPLVSSIKKSNFCIDHHKRFNERLGRTNVSLNDFLRRFATIRCCHKNQCNVTRRCEQFSAYPEKEATRCVFLIGV